MASERYKNMKCKVLFYNDSTKELDVDFNGYGIRLKDVAKNVDEYVTIKYRGEIGCSNFSCKL